MSDLLHRPGMIPAILLACASVTAILWVALATLTPEARQPAKGPVIHAYLMPVFVPAASPAVPHLKAPKPAHDKLG